MTTVHDELPRRPRRRLVTPVTAVLTAVLIAALGFIGGVKVQKAQGTGTGGTGRAAAFARGFGGGAGGGGGGGATVGSVASVDGKNFYVKDSSGTTVRVRTTSNSKITRTAVAKVRDVHPGDTVIVQGTTSSGGTVTATSVAATAADARSGLAGLLGRGADGAAAGGG
jgi:hypothetical protein